VLLAAAALALAIGCAVQYRRGIQNQSCTKELFAMDTVMRLTAYGPHSEEAVLAAVTEIRRLDALLSTGSASSEVSRLNQKGDGDVSEDVGLLLDVSLKLFASTGGAFDCTVYPLMELWGFPSGNYHVPTEEELRTVLPLVDASRLQFDGKTLTLSAGQKVDFGGIAKGYTAQRVMDIFRDYGVTSALISLGGNIQALGAKPNGSDWRIGIQDPDSPQGAYLAVLPVQDQAVVTSGGYERFFVEDGNTYIHILNPKSGYPADSGLVSVTVVSQDGTLADAMSTALFIMGPDEAARFWRTSGGAFDMVMVTVDGELMVTEGICDRLETGESVQVLWLRPNPGA